MKLQSKLTFLNCWIFALIFTSFFAGKVVFGSFASAVSEWLACVLFFVKVPAFKVAIAWTFFKWLFTGSCNKTDESNLNSQLL